MSDDCIFFICTCLRLLSIEVEGQRETSVFSRLNSQFLKMLEEDLKTDIIREDYIGACIRLARIVVCR